MAITLIPNQRFIFFYPQDDCNSLDSQRYCQLIQEGDDTYFQFKQTTCASQSLCNSGFTLGSELVTNGAFATNLTSWITGGFSWSAGAACANGIAQLRQTLSLVTGRIYVLTYTIKNYVTGAVQPAVYDTTGVSRTANGTYTENIIAGTGAVYTALYFNQIGNMCIDDVSLKEVQCWLFSNNNVSISSGQVFHITGLATDITQTGNLTDGVLYQLQINITDRTQGTLTVSIGSNSQVIQANGTQTIYLVADGTTITLSMDSDFDGCITYVFANALRQDYKIGLYDLDGIYVADLTSQALIYYEDEYVTVRIDFIHGTLLDLNGVAVPYGCYKIGLIDTCVEYVCDCHFSGDTCGAYSSHWVLTPRAVIAGGNLTITTTGAINETCAASTINLVDGECYMVCYKISSLTLPSIEIQIGNFSHVFLNAEPQPIVGCEQFTASAVAQLKIICQNGIAGTSVFDYVCIYKCYNFLSNCLSWKALQPCTKSIIGLSSDSDSLGFRFGVFRLNNRLKILSITPSYFQEEEDYLFSDGNRRITFSQSEKYSTLLFDYVDEITHDNIAAMINVDEFYIDGLDAYGLPNPVPYYIKKGEYTPDWDKDGRMKLAQSKIQAKVKDNAIFNSGCQ